MTYKGYTARIDYDDEDGIFTGKIAGIRDGVGFHADSVDALREAFHEAVEDYLETCARIGNGIGTRAIGPLAISPASTIHSSDWNISSPLWRSTTASSQPS